MERRAVSLSPLHRLARLYGVMPEYRDGFRQLRRPAEEAVLAVLRALGAPVNGRRDIESAIEAALHDRWGQIVEPVAVVSSESAPELCLRLPREAVGSSVEVSLESESGGFHEWCASPDRVRLRREVEIAGQRYVLARLSLDPWLNEFGYYRLRVRVSGFVGESLVIHPPAKATQMACRSWGLFMPLHALHSSHSPASGTFKDLGSLIEWLQGLGGSFVSTLPLLATFLDEPYAPSPYTPVSRCFWNEFYLDLPSVPEWRPEFGGIGEQLVGRHVDFRRLMRNKRTALELAARHLGGARLETFRSTLERDPSLCEYASFRASVERGDQGAGKFSAEDKPSLYHAYAQWLATQQIADLDVAASRKGPGLYLDLPLGVHRQGFDMYRHPEIFASAASGGAPPDRFFSKGQDWGFAPLHPHQARVRGHSYFIDCIRHHMRHAGALRIDHVMGLHRTYWIPDGFEGDQGVYVRNPSAELYAIVCIESMRHSCAVVGEDLGTVDRSVRDRMAEHGLMRSYVAQFEFRPDPKRPVIPPPPDAVASINTHDTAMFSAFWSGDDIDDQVDLKLLDDDHAAQARDRRASVRTALLDHFAQTGTLPNGENGADAVLRACLARLASSEARCVIVTLEDLWGERAPQNTPGTDCERPNWRRRASRSFDNFRNDSDVLNALASADDERRQRKVIAP